VNYAVVGAFVLVLCALLIAGTLWIASGGAFQKHYDVYRAIEDESVAGLNLNAPVKFNGVDVGKVEMIALDPANPKRVLLNFAIAHGTPIRVDTYAILNTQGLTGIAYVELSGGTPGAAPLVAVNGEPYPVIRTKPSLSARLENVLSTVLAQLDRTSTNIDALLSPENRAAFSTILTDLATVTHTIARRQGAIDKGIGNAARTFGNTARATEHLDAVIDKVGRAATSLETMGDETAAAAGRSTKTFDSIDAGVQQVNTQTLPDIQRLLVELEALTRSLRALSEETEHDPAALIWGRGPAKAGPGETLPPEIRR
jgi:phospholipid/cholesterol/gamma-HCH transport system substrate-binding protein